MQKSLSRQQIQRRDRVLAWRNNMDPAKTVKPPEELGFGFDSRRIGGSIILNADCFEWLKRISENTLHAIVTDPPYGVKEYDADQLQKREEGKGGVWRIPPAFDGHQRSPLPRFTALDKKERQRIFEFFREWGKLAFAALRPGAHLFIATNTFMSQLVYDALIDGELEFRGEIIRLVQTLRGGDRPKNAEAEFPNVCSMPRGCFEPWGLFRKPLEPRMTVAECLRIFQTGGLRRLPDGNPFKDVIPSERTPQRERKIADHPSLKPQSFLRHVVYVSLPLGEGLLADPFMGSGATVAAAENAGLRCVGIERDKKFFELANSAIPKLACMELDASDPEEVVDGQLTLLEEAPLNVDKSSLLPFSQTRFVSRLP
jgi:site-specific DNA-methyltransferase (adenine-specific)